LRMLLDILTSQLWYYWCLMTRYKLTVPDLELFLWPQ
jgi:hypothetical protein